MELEQILNITYQKWGFLVMYLRTIRRGIVKFCSVAMLITCFSIANITFDANKEKLDIFVNGESLDSIAWQVDDNVKQWIDNNIIETFLNR